MPISLVDVLVAGFASFGVTYTALDAAVPVVALPREWLQSLFERRAAALDLHGESKRVGVQRLFWSSLHTLSGCSWCFSFWSTILVTLFWCRYVAPFDGWPRGVLFSLAAWIVAGFMATLVDFAMTATHTLDDLRSQLNDTPEGS